MLGDKQLTHKKILGKIKNIGIGILKELIRWINKQKTGGYPVLGFTFFSYALF